MRLLSSFLALASFGALASAAAIAAEKLDSPLQMQIALIGNTRIKATLTNNGATTLKLLNKGTILDSNPSEKVQVWAEDNKVPFLGIRYNIYRTDLPEDAFTTLNAQESMEIEFDMAELHDLSAGGSYSVFSAGAIPYADSEDSTELSGNAVAFSSNVLNANVDGVQAARVKLALHTLEDRTTLGNDCNSTLTAITMTALKNCATLSLQASAAAASGNATKFKEYFKVTDDKTRKNVTARLKAVADECNSSTSGVTSYHCRDTYRGCTNSNVLAYTVPSQNYIVNCPLYFNALQPLAKRCHQQDQATTTLHEMTHAPKVFIPGTDDKGYGYAAASKLDSTQALNNADTYALFTNAIYLKC